ncbi:MAG: hypothetical protein IPH37_15500 [Burkholderiales bacterium]|nr:hypothetical protein [Burkholderiales bacterium]
MPEQDKHHDHGSRSPQLRAADSDGTAVDGIVAISAGYGFGMALNNAGQVYTWGSNFMGQLGQNTSNNTSRPLALLVKNADGNGLLSNIKMVSAGGNHAMALDQDGKVFAWGNATSGQLGDGPNRPVMNQFLLPRAVVNSLALVNCQYCCHRNGRYPLAGIGQ